MIGNDKRDGYKTRFSGILCRNKKHNYNCRRYNKTYMGYVINGVNYLPEDRKYVE